MISPRFLGLVGKTGNSLAPHLHFSLMAEPSSLASNGLPYNIDSFQVTAQIPSTEGFDEAEANGTPIAHNTMPTARRVESALPLDQLIISFPAEGRFATIGRLIVTDDC